MKNYLFTSESVTEGHPDKICDQISDAVLDAYLAQDPNARVACETAITTGIIYIMGEITSTCQIDIPKIARKVVREIGFCDDRFGFNADTCAVITSIDQQSDDIALGVNHSMEQKKEKKEEKADFGAGDQGMMFGYACMETKECMPLPITLAHKLVAQLAKVRKDGTLPYIGPDGKSQVTLEYKNGKPLRIDTVVVSTQHTKDVELEQIRKDIIKYVMQPILPEKLFTEGTKILVNPTGRFVNGGPHADSGLTGRKIIVDTYGGCAKHGGGAFSGKDPTKVDRSAAYAARYVAKNIVAAGLAEQCEIELAYAIGVAKPVSIMVETFQTNFIAEEVISKAAEEVFDLRPSSIIEHLELRRPIYQKLASYGHFGRSDLDLPWERTDKADDLKKAVNNIMEK